MAERDRQFEEWLTPGADGKPVSTVQPNPVSETPTFEAYRDPDFLQAYFGNRLLEGKVSACIITFNRHARSMGFVRFNAFEKSDGSRAHEISINYGRLKGLGDRMLMATVVALQVSVWRFEHGPRNRKGMPGTPGYCDRHMSAKLREVGLLPIRAGSEDKSTGYNVGFTIIEGGQFDLDCQELLATGFQIRWQPAADEALCIEGGSDAASLIDPAEARSNNTRTRYVCDCGLKAWSRAGARLACIDCDHTPMIAD